MPTAATTRLARALYGIYAWLALGLAVVPVLAGLAVVPGVRRRRGIARWGAACFFRASRIRIRVRGAPPPDAEPGIIVANHASYLDGILLTAVLPARFTFVIKHEMRRVPVASFVLRRLGSEFVDRARPEHRRRAARRLVGAAREGRALCLFPEGTFGPEPGLRPFQLGAFSAAWRSGIEIVPTAIAGTRAMLPSGARLPRPGALRVHFCEALRPSDYDSPRALMAAARRALLAQLAEPDLGPEDTQPGAGPPTGLRSAARRRPRAGARGCCRTDP